MRGRKTAVWTNDLGMTLRRQAAAPDFALIVNLMISPYVRGMKESNNREGAVSA